MGGEAPLKGIPERGQLGAKATPANSAKHLRVGCPADQRIEHRSSRSTKQRVTTRELYPGIWSTFSKRWTSLVRSSICALR